MQKPEHALLANLVETFSKIFFGHRVVQKVISVFVRHFVNIDFAMILLVP